MLSLQEISDRLTIERMLVDYAHLIDTGEFDGLDRLFAPDAFIDHSANGSYVGRYPGFKAFLKVSLPKFPHYYHLMGNAVVDVRGDEATARCACLCPMEVPLVDGTSQVMFIGFWYDTELGRADDSWRFRTRVQQACFQYNAPDAARSALTLPQRH